MSSAVTLQTRSGEPDYASGKGSVTDVAKLCPSFNNDVVKNVTPLIHDCLLPVTENMDKYSVRVRDILLMSVLTFFSALFGMVRILYDTKRYSLNLFYVLKSDAGSNKSIMTLANCITRKVNAYLLAEYEKEHKQWKRDCLAWEAELALAKKEKYEPNWDIEPGDEPQCRLIEMPTNTSRSQLMLTACAMVKDGLLMKSTEINSLCEAFSKDYGQFADMLCKMALNESDGQYYKVDGKPIIVEQPMISIGISGTDDQYHKLFPILGDGWFSRCLHHQGETDTQWRDQRPPKDKDGYESLYEEISNDALQMWLWQRSTDGITVVFSEKQWDRHNSFWEGVNDEFVRECGSDLLSIPRRHGFMQMRIAAILTMLRLWDENRDRFSPFTFCKEEFNPEVECQDVDFEIAEHITYTLYQHAMAISTTKKKQKPVDVCEMSDWHWIDNAMLALHEKFGEETFTTKDFITHLMSAPWDKSQSTAYRHLDLLRHQKLLKPMGRGTRRRWSMSKAYVRRICKK